MRAIKSGEVSERTGVREFLKEALSIQLLDSARIDDHLRRLTTVLCQTAKTSELERYSTIHKAKGLQAEAVLAVARTANELEKWLFTSKEQRAGDKNDTCRIGYVAFSRAMQVLCIACLKPIGNALKEKLTTLDVGIV
jgi:DNA helicase-2/ATP-dependent DNA helicase PcrA